MAITDDHGSSANTYRIKSLRVENLSPGALITVDANKVLQSSNSYIDLGGKRTTRSTTPPINPAIGDVFEELTSTNQWVRDWFWNGSYWLSTQEFNKSLSVTLTGGLTYYFDLPVNTNVFVLAFNISFLLGATNSTALYWTFTIGRSTGISTSSSLAPSVSSANLAASTWWLNNSTINSHINIAATGTKAFKLDIAKIGTPTNIIGGTEISYRLARI